MRYRLFMAAAIGAASPAFAEEPAAEIVVTGTLTDDIATGSKTNTLARDVPAAIVVIPAAILREQDVRTLDDALSNASAVSPNFAGGYGLADNYNIRGLPMRFLRDGLPDGPTFVGYRRTLADNAAIEVLKGPGSALYGRSEAGGTVNLTTLAPDDAFGAAASASYARFDDVSLTGDVSVPLAGGLSARLIGNYEETDGYRGLARRFIDVLPTLAADLGRHRLVLDYDRREQRSVVDNYGIPFTTAKTLVDVDRDARFYSAFNRVEQDIDRLTLTDRFEASPVLSLRAAFVYDARTIAIARNAGGNPINAAGVMTGRNGRTQRDDAEYLTGQFEGVLTPRTGGIAHTVLIGAEYQRATIDTVRRNYALPNTPIVSGTARAPETAIGTTTPAFERRIHSDTLSVYLQEQADIGETLKVRAGVRYDGVKLVDDGTQGTTPRRIAGSPGLISWQAGAVYQPTRRLSLYGGYARGKFVAVQTESTALSPIPESSSQIELGMKAELVSGKLNLNAAVFETKREDFFVTLIAGGDPVQAGRQRARGVEVDVIGSPVAGLSVIGNVAYVDAVNRSNALATATGIAVNQPVLGKRLAATPKWSGSLWGAYTVPTGRLTGVMLGAGATYKGATYADALELLRVPDYLIVRAAIGYDLGPVQAQLTVANLTGARYFSVPTFIGALPGDPRTVRFTLRTKI